MERVQKNERKLKEAQGQLEKWEKAVEDAQRAADDDDDEAFESDLADVRAKIKDNAKQQAAIRVGLLSRHANVLVVPAEHV
jgi:predicted  nucleic acid-binding Zn-ribbon protein